MNRVKNLMVGFLLQPDLFLVFYSSLAFYSAGGPASAGVLREY